MIGYQVLKLSSGDDVICSVVSDIKNTLKVSDPLKMDTVNRFTKKGLVESLALSRWIQPYSDEDFFYIDKSSVMLMAPASIGLSRYYEYVIKKSKPICLIADEIRWFISCVIANGFKNINSSVP